MNGTIARMRRVRGPQRWGKFLVIWDGAPIHKGQPIKEFLTRGPQRGSSW